MEDPFDETRKAAARDQERIEQATEIIMDLVAHGCTVDTESETWLDSMASGTYADAMRFLAERGKIEINRECGRRVIGRWKEA